MGRLQYLERLALGRSAFQEADGFSEAVTERQGAGWCNQQAVSPIVRHYDAKGRPSNPATDARNHDMRNAQNAAYSLVGVVESKNASERELEALVRQRRQQLLEAEHDCGQNFDLLTPLTNSVLTWWPETLIQKVQAGAFAASMSFTDIVVSELWTDRPRGINGLLGALLRGLPAWMVFYFLKTLVGAVVGEGIGQLQEWLNKRVSRKTLKPVNRLVILGCEITHAAVDVALLPLQYFAFSQSIGLLSAWPLLPSWRFLSPLRSSIVHSSLWAPTYGTSALARLTSPAALMLLKNFLERDQVDGLPIANQLTTFEYPPINASTAVSARLRLKLDRDPLGRLLYQFYTFRARLMRWFGWNLTHSAGNPSSETKYLNNHRPRPESASTQHAQNEGPNNAQSRIDSRHRSTALAHHPPQFVADRIDDIFARMLMLPLDSLVIRAIALSYSASEWAGTAQDVAAGRHFHLPFGGGPLSALRLHGFRGAAWYVLGSYANKLGLSLALNYLGEAGVFFIVYGLCRARGLRKFGWVPPVETPSRRLEGLVGSSTDLSESQDGTVEAATS